MEIDTAVLGTLKKSLQEAETAAIVVIQPIVSFAQGKPLNLRRPTYRCLRESQWQDAFRKVQALRLAELFPTLVPSLSSHMVLGTLLNLSSSLSFLICKRKVMILTSYGCGIDE